MRLFTLKDRLIVYLGTLVFAGVFGGAGYLMGEGFGAIIGVIISMIPAQITITRMVRKSAEKRVQTELTN